MQSKWSFVAVALLSTIAFSSHAQSIGSLTGNWELSADAFFGAVKGNGTGGDCQFEGNASIAQSGSTFTGTAAMSLVSGSQRCPAEMDARVDGTVANGAIQMSMLMGSLGTAEFNGQATQKGIPVGGGFSVVTGPFAGAGGSWLGTPNAQVVPTAGVWALAALVLLLVAAGTLFLRRRPTY